MSVRIAPVAKMQFFDANGAPLSGGTVTFYAAGSSTPQDTYTDSTGNTANANPITLNSRGETPSGVWLTQGLSYKYVLKDSGGSTIWTEDNIEGVNDASVSIDQWVASGLTPTYVSGTQFTVVGDQTTDLHVGRRVKCTVTAGTVYGVITASAYTTLTTVTVAIDSGSLDSGLSAVSLGLLTATDPSVPILSDAFPIVSGSADRTKKLRIEVDGITTGTTRVLTAPDFDGTIATLAGAETLTNKTLTSPVINTGISGTAVADQTAMEAASSTTLVVTPGRARFSPYAIKLWGKVNNAGSVSASAGVSSVTDTGTGQATVNFSVNFSSVNYSAWCNPLNNSTSNFMAYVESSSLAVGSMLMVCLNASTGGATDPTSGYTFGAAGDQ